MKTDQLIDLLATNVGTVEVRAVSRRVTAAVVAGASGSVLLLVVVFGLNPQLASYLLLPAFWTKLAFAAAVAAGGIAVTARLARPGTPVGAAKWWLLAALAVIWLLALAQLAATQPGLRSALLLGATWRKCPFSIALLSVPVFIASLWALRELAPTRLRLAGAAAGLAAGGLAAFVYGLHCPELATPFIAVFYVLGMLIPTTVGFLLGPRLLRW
jgi:hypothetical protein